jgi:hypothetical protein
MLYVLYKMGVESVMEMAIEKLKSHKSQITRY